MGNFLRKKIVPNVWKNSTKTHLGPMLGKTWLEKNSGRSLVRSDEIPGPGQTSIDKTNGCILNYEQSALVRGPRITIFTPWQVSCGGS